MSATFQCQRAVCSAVGGAESFSPAVDEHGCPRCPCGGRTRRVDTTLMSRDASPVIGRIVPVVELDTHDMQAVLDGIAVDIDMPRFAAVVGQPVTLRSARSGEDIPVTVVGVEVDPVNCRQAVRFCPRPTVPHPAFRKPPIVVTISGGADLYEAMQRANAKVGAVRIGPARAEALDEYRRLAAGDHDRTIPHVPALSPTALAALGRKPLAPQDPLGWDIDPDEVP